MWIFRYANSALSQISHFYIKIGQLSDMHIYIQKGGLTTTYFSVINYTLHLSLLLSKLGPCDGSTSTDFGGDHDGEKMTTFLKLLFKTSIRWGL